MEDSRKRERNHFGNAQAGDNNEWRPSLRELVRNGKWEELKENEDYQRLDFEDKIHYAKSAVKNRLAKYQDYFNELIASFPNEAGIVLEKRIKPLRRLTDALNAAFARSMDKDQAERVKMLGIEPPAQDASGTKTRKKAA